MARAAAESRYAPSAAATDMEEFQKRVAMPKSSTMQVSGGRRRASCGGGAGGKGGGREGGRGRKGAR